MFKTIRANIPSMENNPQPPDSHETTDTPTRPVWITGFLLVISCILIALAVSAMFHSMQRGAKTADLATTNNGVAPSVAASKEQFPAPRLQVAPEVDLAALRARENEELDHYGWIDKNAGVVRIPIDRAMDLIASRGLPVQGQAGAPTPYRTSLDMQQARPLERETPNPTPIGTK